MGQRYKSLVLSLLPRGEFWQVERGSLVDLLIDGLAHELNAVEEKAQGLFSLLNWSSGEASSLRWATLLNIPASTSLISHFMNRNLTMNRKSIETTLRAFGHTDFIIYDASEYTGGLDPIIEPKYLGSILFILPLRNVTSLRAGFPAGSRLNHWEDAVFERHARTLIPAHLRAIFSYRHKEQHAEN